MSVAGIAALWVAFAASHMGLSSLRLRPRLVATLGAGGFQGLYSLLALAIFVPLVALYFGNQHAGPHLWYLGPSPLLRGVAYALMALAMTLVLGGLLRPSPTGMIPGKTEVRGVLRITRHPAFMGAGLFGLIHLLVANVNAAELLFFGGFPVFAVLGCRHQDQRRLADGGEAFQRFYEQTALLPFTRGGALAGLRESPLAVALGVGSTLLLRYFHPGWFGGAP